MFGFNLVVRVPGSSEGSEVTLMNRQLGNTKGRKEHPFRALVLADVPLSPAHLKDSSSPWSHVP